MSCGGKLVPFLILIFSGILLAQQAAPPTPEITTKPVVPAAEMAAQPLVPAAESPSDLYQRAMQPVDIVRRSPGNITESEMAAWGVAVVTAAHACVRWAKDRGLQR